MKHSLGFDTLTFAKDVSEISVCDYGDFMRTANVYLNHLRDEFKVAYDKNIDRRIDEMQMYLQFLPNWNIESTRERLINDTQYLNDLLYGHQQDWESASPDSGRINPL